jgi:AraC-like DNA-binding protein
MRGSAAGPEARPTKRDRSAQSKREFGDALSSRRARGERVTLVRVTLAYEEWVPGARLRGLVTAFWHVTGNATGVPASSILPDGHVELVFNLGAPVQLDGPQYRGEQPERAVVGSLSKAIALAYSGPVDTFGIRLHPARGAGFFGRSATELTDRLQPLAEVSEELDRALETWAAARPDPAAERDRARLELLLLAQLQHALPADEPIVTLVDRLTSQTEAPAVATMARELSLSPRQLQRRFLAAVGLSPKHFVRVVRFARVWLQASMQEPETWAELAAANGYADQAHLVREFRDFGALPPTHQFQPEWYDTTSLTRSSGPSSDVRSVQDAPRLSGPSSSSKRRGAPRRSRNDTRGSKS